MWHVNLEGGPRAVGEQYAKRLQPKFRFYLPEARRVLRQTRSEEWITRVTARVLGNLRAAVPDLAEEIEACAGALEVPCEDVVMLVAYSDLWWGLDSNEAVVRATEKAGDCTNLGLREACDEPILGQTFDLPDPGQFFVQTLYPERGYPMLCVHRLAPARLSCGVNQTGLCCAGVSSCCRSQDLDGLPICVLLRRMLQRSASVEEAVGVMRSHPILSGAYTVQVMQRDGRSVVLECAACGVEVVESDRPFLYNTRFRTERMRRLYEGVPDQPCVARAEKRLHSFERLLNDETPPYSEETVKRAFSDHSADGPIWDWTTAFAVIMHPRRACLELHEGPPDCSWPESYSLQETKPKPEAGRS